MKAKDLIKILMIIGLFLVFYNILMAILTIVGLIIFLPLWLTSPQFWCVLLAIILIIWYFKSRK